MSSGTGGGFEEEEEVGGVGDLEGGLEVIGDEGETETRALREGPRTDAKAADELSCSPSTAAAAVAVSERASACRESTSSSANLLAARPLGAVAWLGDLGDGRGADFVCGGVLVMLGDKEEGSVEGEGDRGGNKTDLCFCKLSIFDFEIGFHLLKSGLEIRSFLIRFLNQLSHGIIQIM